MTFSEVEAVLGQPLPASAFTYPAWWANDPTPNRQSEAWLKVGYRAENVDLRHGALVFRRAPQAAAGREARTEAAAGARAGGKYRMLGDHLSKASGRTVRMSFAEIERVLGFPLPESAFRHRAWWSNNASNNVMTQVWLDAGFRTARVDVAGGVLEFERRMDSDAEAGGDMPGGFADAAAPYGDKPKATRAVGAFIGCMKGTVRVAKGFDLTGPADPDWGDSTPGVRE